MSRLLRRFMAPSRPRRTRSPVARPASPKARLLLQALEGRIVPATFTVMNTNDSGTGSVRDAITKANAALGADTIVFDPTVFGTAHTIALASDLPTIGDDLTLIGPGSGLLTLQKGTTTGAYFSGMSIGNTNGLTVNVSGLTVAGAGNFGFALGNGVIGLTDVVVTGSGQEGIRVSEGIATLTGVTVRGNRGGITEFLGGKLTVRQSTIAGNSTSGNGGGIYAQYSSLLLTDSTVSANTGSSGGGIFVSGRTGPGGLTIRNSTISGNLAKVGGGIGADIMARSVLVQNSTITGNTTTAAGNIGAYGGGGILMQSRAGAANLVLQSTIVAGNVVTGAPAATADISGSDNGTIAVRADHSLIGVADFIAFAAGSSANVMGTVAAPLDPLLGPLANNGGSVQTRLLLAGSPAFDRGSNPFGLATDQRGNSRVDGIAPDVGAVEGTSPGLPMAGAGLTPPITAGGGTNYQFTVTYQGAAGIAVNSLGNGNVIVTGPNGFSTAATLVGIDTPTDGSPRTATYRITAPTVGGVYSISLQPNQVFDTAGHAVLAGTLGTFQAQIPRAFTISTLSDSGPGSLRDAIIQANAVGSTADTITFAVSGSLSLLSPLPAITNSVTISGPGSGLLTISGGSSGLTSPFGTLTVDGTDGLTIQVSGLTVSGNHGSGLYLSGADVFTLNDVAVIGNSTSSYGGGVLIAGGSLTMQNCTVAANTAGGFLGGGIYATGGANVTLENTTVVGNKVGGTYGGNGAGVCMYSANNLLLENSSVTGNTCVGSNGYGGGVYVSGLVSGVSSGVIIRNTTISLNSADTGGGVCLNSVTGTVLIQNSTITNNTATSTQTDTGYGGGGIAARAQFVPSSGTVLTLQSTIVAGNVQTAGTVRRPDLSIQPGGMIPVTADHSLIGVLDAGVLTSGSGNDIFGTAAVPLDPMLGPVGLPLSGSPAIDRGSNPANLATDQTGQPRVNGFAPDIGAVEGVSSGLPVAVAASVATVTAGGGASQQIRVTYQSGAAIAVSSLDGSDILVTGPNGFSTPASFVSVDNPTNGTPRTATYSFTPPGGTWIPADNGTYYLAVQPNQVFDTNSNSVPANTLGTFQVLIAQTFTVTTLADSGPGSLRDAITQANAFPGTADTIVFSTSLFSAGPATISLSSALPTIADSLSITGPTLANGTPVLTVTPSPTAATQFRIFDINGPGILAVNISNMAVTGSAGGGIQDADEILNLSNMVVSQNVALNGGGIYVGNGQVTLTNSTVTSNVAGAGAGIYGGYRSSLIINSSRISGNTIAGSGNRDGGGIYTYGASAVSVTNSTISGNAAPAGGGGAIRGGLARFIFVGNTVSGNTASNGAGGGLYFLGPSGSGTLAVADCTITGNVAASGGGIALMSLYGTFAVQNSTITANTATAATTASGQGGGGISVLSVYTAYAPPPSTLLLQSTIVGGNVATNGRADIAAPTVAQLILTADHSLIGAADAGFTLAAGSANNLTGTVATPLDPRLTPFEDNGGPTFTLAPLPGSPVINAGSNPSNLTMDQRGSPRNLGAAPDIGAVEHVPNTPFAVRGSLPTVSGSPGGTVYRFTVTYYDDMAIDVSTLDGNDVRVTGPNGFSAAATFVGVDTNSNGSPRTATYSIVPPGGAWTNAANGTYTVAVQANQVFNTTGAAAPAVSPGTFLVALPLTFTVTSLADNGPGSLRDAILRANTLTPSADTIVFDPALFAAGSGTISLASALPTISDSLTITGPVLANGQPQLTVRGNSNSSGGFRVFDVNGPGALTVNLSNMVVSGGYSGSYTGGGGIQNADENLTLTNLVVTGNTSTYYGGGIYSDGGTLTLTNCTVANNAASYYGGGIAAEGTCQVVVSNSSISANSGYSQNYGSNYLTGGGVYLAESATMTMTGSSVMGNTAARSGGGIYTVSTSAVAVTNSTIAGNRSVSYGGGIYAAGGPLTLTNSMIRDNTVTAYSYYPDGYGGGVFAGYSTRLTVTNSTLTGNSAGAKGGGLYAATEGVVSVVNSTVSGNTSGSGGGVAARGGKGLALIGSTVSGNSASGTGGGLYVSSTALAIRNSTIANNTALSGGGVGAASMTGILQVQNSTIFGNTATTTTNAGGQGGGIAVVSVSGDGASFVLQSSVVAGDLATSGLPDISSVVPVLADHSLIGIGVGFTFADGSANNLMGTVLTRLDPQLGPFQNNGGPMATLAPLPGSPVIDAGSNPANLPTDQRGSPRVLGSATDIGALEHDPAAPFAARGSLPNVVSIPGGTTYQFTVTYYDDNAINTATATNGNAVRVTGPNGFSATAVAGTVDFPTNGSPRTVTYTVVPPGGVWTGADNGTYTASVQANQVFNTAGAAAPAVTLGTFQVVLPVTFMVTTLAATGPGSLVDAVNQANALAPTTDTIAFDPSLFTSGPATITATLPTITDGVNIVGPGSALLKLSLSSRMQVTGPGPMTFSVSGLTLSKGSSGVLMVTNTAATLSDVTIQNGTGGGGLIVDIGSSVTVRNSHILNNTGGPNVFYSGRSFVTGGGVTVATGASLTVDNSTIAGNSSLSGGGGINLSAGANLLVENSTIGNNTAFNASTSGGGARGAGIFVAGTPGPGGATILNSTVSGNTTNVNGGGLFATGAMGAAGLTIRNTTIAGNTSSSGGGIDLQNVSGNVLIQNSTITGNTANTSNATVGYGGGGIAAQSATAISTLSIQSTIVAGNYQTTSTANRPDISATPNNVVTITADHSLIGMADTITLSSASNGNVLGTTANPLNSLLGPLANNGGPNQTQAPLAGSLAIDRGANPANLATDEAGNPRVSGIAADIGAIEVTSPGFPIAVAGPTPAVTTAGGTTYQFIVTYEGATAISVASIGTGNVSVIGPNGFAIQPTLLSVDNPTNGSPRTATYAFTPPGGAWSPAADGNYYISLNANQVFDTAGNAVAAGSIGAFGVQIAQAFTVTSLADSGPGTLRDAITQANGAVSADTIQFDPALFAGGPGVASLLTALPAITDNLTITGPGSGLLTVRRDPSATAAFSVLSAGAPGALAINLSGMTISGGSLTGLGGGLNLSDETATLSNMVVSGNTAGTGGGISSTGTLIVRNSSISGNVANGTAPRDEGGGGIYVGTGGTLLLDSSTVSANTSTGAGGISAVTSGGNQPVAVTIRNSTIAQNVASYAGGGIYISGSTGISVLIQNSTITANTAAYYGAGIYLFAYQPGTLAVQSSIVAGNAEPFSSTQSGLDFYVFQNNGPVSLSVDHCLIGDADGLIFSPASSNNRTGTLAAPLDPKLGPLGNNGGPVQTCALHLGSPAVDAGSNPANLPTDERGAPRVQGAAADIGAFERTPGAPDAIAGTLPRVATAGPTNYQFTVTYADDTAIDVASLDGNDVRVTGPNGYNQLATLVSINQSGNGTPRTATYAITPPGGLWHAGDFGTYSLTVEPNQVVNTAGVSVPAMPLGSFQVAVPVAFTVTNLSDSGAGSLRQAMLDANTAPTPDIIQFDPSLFATGPATINLLSALPTISDDLTITGPGANLLTVSNATFAVANNLFRMVTVSGLTANAIYAGTGSFTLLNSVVSGGGIQVGLSGFLTVKGSIITGHRSAGSGGGIQFPGNNSFGASLDVENSTISGNSVTGSGGGIYFYGSVGHGGFTIRNSTIVGNTAGGSGGAIYTSYASGTFVIQNSTIAQNTAAGGGAIAVNYPAPTSFIIQSSIIAGDTAASGPDFLLGAGATSSAGLMFDHSLIGVQPSGYYSVTGSTNSMIGTAAAPLDPKLAPLGNYGGPTQTVALLAGSSALNTGSNPAGLTTDQRGSPRTVGPAPDIGAYEYNPITIANVQVNDGSAQRSEVRSIAVTFSGPVTFAGGTANAVAPFQLKHVTDGVNVALAAAVSTDGQGRTVVTLTFSGTETDALSAMNGGIASLADGRFQLTVNGGLVTDPVNGLALDGDANGVAGGNYLSPTDTITGGTGQLRLYRLFGDATGDGVVDQRDLGQFRSTFNAGAGNPLYLAYLDADNSGFVDQVDLGQLRSRFNANIFSSGPATVASVVVNDGSAQRSEVRSIAVTFSVPVAFGGGNANAAAAFQLMHLTDNNNVGLTTTVSADSLGRTVVTITFSGPETDSVSAQNFGSTSLADGRYQLTILSSSVTGADGVALVGGGPNSNYVSPTDTLGGGAGQLHLYRIFGDVNGDGLIDQQDLGKFRSAFNAGASSSLYIPFLDADNSGVVDQVDLGQFRSRFNANVF